MPPITLAQARTVIDTALAEARRPGFKPMAVVVVDAAAAVGIGATGWGLA